MLVLYQTAAYIVKLFSPSGMAMHHSSFLTLYITKLTQVDSEKSQFSA